MGASGGSRKGGRSSGVWHVCHSDEDWKKKGMERGNHVSIFTARQCEDHWKQAGTRTRTTVTYHHTQTHNKSSSRSALLNFNACFRGKFYSNIKAYTVWLWMCCLHVGRGVWQVGPDQPLLHTQENWSTSSTHVPPLRHGEEAHSLISDWKEEDWMAKVDFCIWTGTAERSANAVEL